MEKYGNRLKGMEYVCTPKVIREAIYTLKLLKIGGVKIDPNNIDEIQLQDDIVHKVLKKASVDVWKNLENDKKTTDTLNKLFTFGYKDLTKFFK